MGPGRTIAVCVMALLRRLMVIHMMLRGRIVMLDMMRRMRRPWVMGIAVVVMVYGYRRIMVSLIRRRRGDTSRDRGHVNQTQQKNHCALHGEPSLSGIFPWNLSMRPIAMRTGAVRGTGPVRSVPAIGVSVVAVHVRAMTVSMRGAMALRSGAMTMMPAIRPAMPVHAGSVSVAHAGAVPVRPAVSLHSRAMPVRAVGLPGVSLHAGAVGVMPGMPLHVSPVATILDMRGRMPSVAGRRNAEPAHADRTDRRCRQNCQNPVHFLSSLSVAV